MFGFWQRRFGKNNSSKPNGRTSLNNNACCGKLKKLHNCLYTINPADNSSPLVLSKCLSLSQNVLNFIFADNSKYKIKTHSLGL